MGRRFPALVASCPPHHVVYKLLCTTCPTHLRAMSARHHRHTEALCVQLRLPPSPVPVEPCQRAQACIIQLLTNWKLAEIAHIRVLVSTLGPCMSAPGSLSGRVWKKQLDMPP